MPLPTHGTAPCRALGDCVAGGPPTRPEWAKKYGDNRVRVMLAMPSNHVVLPAGAPEAQARAEDSLVSLEPPPLPLPAAAAAAAAVAEAARAPVDRNMSLQSLS